MKQIILYVFLFVFIGCTNDGTPTGPPASTGTPVTPPPAATWYYLDLTGYGETLEPNFLKVSSDGSWEKYGGTENVNGSSFRVMLASDSARFYYTSTTGQYAGYRPKGQNPIMFDAPQGVLPARWCSDLTVTLTVNFSYMGTSVSTKSTYTLVDTTPIVTLLGSFCHVAHFSVRVDMSASSGEASSTSQEIWLARGPGGIKSIRSGGIPVYFVHGYVNGQPWGSQPSAHKTAAGTVSPAESFVRGMVR